MPLLPVPVDGNRQINLARQLRHCLHNYIQWHILYLLRYYSFVIAEWLLLTCIIRSTLLLQSSKMFIDIEDTDYKIDGSYYLCGNYTIEAANLSAI